MKPMRNQDMQTLPLLPLRGLVILPGSVITLDAGRARSIAAAEQAMNSDRRIFIVAQRNAMTEHPGLEDLYSVGVVATIRQMMQMPDHSVRLLVQGEARAILLSVRESADCQYAGYAAQNLQAESEVAAVESRAYMRTIASLCQELERQRGGLAPELMRAIVGERMPGMLCDLAAGNLLTSMEAKQQVLECFDVNIRLEMTLKLLAEEIHLQEVEERIQERVREAMDRANHEYYLREQVHAIQDELGEAEDEEIAGYRKKLAESAMPEEARDKVTRELRRLARTAPQSPEASVSQNYIEYMLERPWGAKQDSEIDIARARKVLEADHYGLKEVKVRLVEYLAVRKYTDALKSPIICLVGPPGVGKTSIAKSIARALNRKFTQMSLGGVHDEAEVRGHRKTYVGAMPGRIVSSIKRCGSMNPVFLLDEIDKIARDMRGDPAAALLEALDPEQNTNFRDHYLEAPFDLSDVLFITTANSVEPIDRALLDRMEVIEVPSYTQEEKVKIARRYLLPRQIERHGLKRTQLRASERTLLDVIDGYTREAGVRTLERTIERLCRKAAVQLIENPERKCVTLRPQDLKTYLGPQRYLRQPAGERAEVGVVNGLAWTSVGGELMPVEAVALDGKGNLEITGKLGEVMRESAKIARTIARARAADYKIDAEYFEKHDLHIHVPEGAVPKDGPSAGVALSCAVVSAITGMPARGDVAMTGEVTLHGKVLPIGGVREKLLAAYRLGVTNILLPRENEKDLEEIDAEIRRKLNVTLIDTVDDALNLVLTTSKQMRLAI